MSSSARIVTQALALVDQGYSEIRAFALAVVATPGPTPTPRKQRP